MSLDVALTKAGVAAGTSLVSGSHPASVVINAGVAFSRALLGAPTAPISAAKNVKPLATG